MGKTNKGKFMDNEIEKSFLEKNPGSVMITITQDAEGTIKTNGVGLTVRRWDEVIGILEIAKNAYIQRMMKASEEEQVKPKDEVDSSEGSVIN